MKYPAWFLKLYESRPTHELPDIWDRYIRNFGHLDDEKQKLSPTLEDIGIIHNQETKPTNPKDRLATNRLDLSLFPATARAYGALGMTEGDCKYGGYNYRKFGVSASTYYSACGRHLDDWYNGEWADRKTGVPHLASALACIAILIDSYERRNMVDDRPPKVDFRDLLERAESLSKKLHELFPNGPKRFTEVE